MELYCTLGTHVIPGIFHAFYCIGTAPGTNVCTAPPCCTCTVSVAALDPAEVSVDVSAVPVYTGNGLGKDELQLIKRMIATQVRQISCVLF